MTLSTRASRYERNPDGPQRRGFGPTQREALSYITEYRFLLTSQLARLMRMTNGNVSKHTRVLKDWGFIYAIRLNRGDLDPTLPNDDTRNRGSSEDVLVPTKAGVACLIENDFISEEAAARTLPKLGPQQGLRIAHDLMAHDLRVWLTCAEMDLPGSRISVWREGTEECQFVLPPSEDGPKSVTPDAWCLFERPNADPIVALVEADRGTMTARNDWEDKVWRYAHLFASPVLQTVSGHRKGIVLTLTPDESRAVKLATEVHRAIKTQPLLADRFLFTPWQTLSQQRIGEPLWRLPSGKLTVLRG